MGPFINLYANATGLWKKVAQFLPLVVGAGSVLVGAGSILLQVGHAPDAAAALKALTGLSAQDPNVVLILGGLAALGVHTNHTEIKAAVADATAVNLPNEK